MDCLYISSFPAISLVYILFETLCGNFNRISLNKSILITAQQNVTTKPHQLTSLLDRGSVFRTIHQHNMHCSERNICIYSTEHIVYLKYIHSQLLTIKLGINNVICSIR